MQHLFGRGLRRSSALLFLSGAAWSVAWTAAAGHAQSAPPPPGTSQPADAQQPAEPQTITQLPQQSPQERARILKEAQARVMNRRRLREQQVIEDTYSHKYELYAGGGYLRFRPGRYLQHMNEEAWNVGVTEWLRPKLGIAADFRGYYGTANALDFTNRVYTPSISQYTFMAGPQYRAYANTRWSVAAQVLAGIGHGNFATGTRGVPAADVGVYADGNVLNLSAGVPIDYNLGPTLAVRLTPAYLLTNYGSEIQHNLGFTTGLVYRWGRQ